ncbi:hypothetical protein Dole_2641 [Desulfosudis oleivorans Hxd3]|uniref:Uncharacterized protein n=2 Tax=Desulfosudis TaxID=2904716 RepID=A8ZWW3_DESOH|nr:hypothetical protein Dole_2641 [Desulfosudis oleivorans Hxd3]
MQIIGNRVVEGGKGRKIYDVKLLKNDRCILKPYCKNNPLDCSFEFSTDANLEVEWSNTQESTLLLRVIAQDSFTSFSKVYEQEYFSIKEAIINGRFAIGKKMIIHR